MIRQATHQDITSIRDEYRLLFAEMAQLQPQFWNASEQSEQFRTDTINGEESVIFVTEEQGEIQGFVLAVTQQTPPYPCVKPYKYAYLMDRVVS